MLGTYINDVINNVFPQCRVDCFCLFLERTFLGSVSLRIISATVLSSRIYGNLVKRTKCKVVHLYPNRSFPVIFALSKFRMRC